MATKVRDILADGEGRAYKLWRETIYGDGVDVTTTGDGEMPERTAMRNMGSLGAGLVIDAGEEDPEHPLSRRRGQPCKQP